MRACVRACVCVLSSCDLPIQVVFLESDNGSAWHHFVSSSEFAQFVTLSAKVGSLPFFSSVPVVFLFLLRPSFTLLIVGLFLHARVHTDCAKSNAPDFVDVLAKRRRARACMLACV